MRAGVTIHPTADVAEDAQVGSGTRIWHQAQVREGAVIGRGCVLGKAVYIDRQVHLGNGVKIQNYVAIYHGATLEDGVFVGPNASLVTDRYPRALTPNGRLKDEDDWEGGQIRICEGASIGAGAVILPDVTVGRYVMVGAGAVVTSDVEDHRLVVGNPARTLGYVCVCGRPLQPIAPDTYRCATCSRELIFKGEDNP